MPVAPLLSLPPTFECPQGRFWLFDDTATALDQITLDAMNDEAAAFLTGAFQFAINTRYVWKGRKVRYIHDWRACGAYSTNAREKLIEWGRQGHSMTAETIIALSPSSSAFVRIAVATAMMVMKGLRMKIDVRESLDGVVSELSRSTPVSAEALRR